MNGLGKVSLLALWFAGVSPAVAAVPPSAKPAGPITWLIPPDLAFTERQARLLGMSSDLADAIHALLKNNGWVAAPDGAPPPPAIDIVEGIYKRALLVERHLGKAEAETYKLFQRLVFDKYFAEAFDFSPQNARILHRLDWLMDTEWASRHFKPGTMEWLMTMEKEGIVAEARHARIIEEYEVAKRAMRKLPIQFGNIQRLIAQRERFRNLREERRKKDLRLRVQQVSEYNYIHRKSLQERAQYFKHAYTR